jgi:hypothetical protein
MPVRVTRDDAAKRILAIGEGEFRAEDIIDVLTDLRESGAWAYQIVFDVRRMSGTTTTAAIKPILDLTAPGGVADAGRGPIAIVAAGRLYAMACAYATLARWERTQVFPDRSEAEQWLGSQVL